MNKIQLEDNLNKLRKCSQCLIFKQIKDNFNIIEYLPDKYKIQSPCNDCRKSNRNTKGHIKVITNRFNITESEYINLIEIQNNSCAICGEKTTDRKLAVDHCHETDVVRGLLCINCNLGLGNFKDSPELLSKAINYLNRNLMS